MVQQGEKCLNLFLATAPIRAFIIVTSNKAKTFIAEVGPEMKSVVMLGTTNK